MKIKVAFAVSNKNEFEDRHFGDADKFLVYQWDDEKLTNESELLNHSKLMDESEAHGSKLKGNSIIATLKMQGVKVLVSKQFGRNINMVNKHFIPVLISTSSVEDACDILLRNQKALEQDLQSNKDSYKVYNLRLA
ncbi:MAG: NifB/NifX family molybdenum-iron cluster-binding protein [Bacteroidota bacterium]